MVQCALTHTVQCASHQPFDFHKGSHWHSGPLPDVRSAFVAAASFLCSPFNLLIYLLGFSEGQEEHETWRSAAAEGAIFRVPRAAQISSRAKGWVPGPWRMPSARVLPLRPAGQRHARLLGRFLCGSLSPPLPGRPGRQRRSGGAHAASMENAWEGNRNNGAETWEEGTASR